mmetsp:Transcript_40034/g.74383  ORF Transcript_40034/g.74383 Transcript_40034/m.74383 type:complete len:230 (+) Transcript_40034:46-735(+)
MNFNPHASCSKGFLLFFFRSLEVNRQLVFLWIFFFLFFFLFFFCFFYHLLFSLKGITINICALAVGVVVLTLACLEDLILPQDLQLRLHPMDLHPIDVPGGQQRTEDVAHVSEVINERVCIHVDVTNNPCEPIASEADRMLEVAFLVLNPLIEKLGEPFELILHWDADVEVGLENDVVGRFLVIPLKTEAVHLAPHCFVLLQDTVVFEPWQLFFRCMHLHANKLCDLQG